MICDPCVGIWFLKADVQVLPSDMTIELKHEIM